MRIGNLHLPTFPAHCTPLYPAFQWSILSFLLHTKWTRTLFAVETYGSLCKCLYIYTGDVVKHSVLWQCYGGNVFFFQDSIAPVPTNSPPATSFKTPVSTKYPARTGSVYRRSIYGLSTVLETFSLTRHCLAVWCTASCRETLGVFPWLWLKYWFSSRQRSEPRSKA